MRRISTVFRIIAVFVLAAFLIWSPPFIEKSLHSDLYRSWLEGKKEEWTGVITLWHVVSFKTYQGSVTSFLSERANEYEASHKGVFWNVEGMTVEEAEARIARGERPDTWSFACGALYEEQLAALGGIRLYGRTREDIPLAMSGDQLLGVPYLLSVNCILCNADYLYKHNIVPPEQVDLPWLKNMLAEQNVPLACDDPISAASYGMVGSLCPYSDFSEGKVPFALADARALGDIARKLNAGKGFSFLYGALGEYTAQVQYIGIDAKASAQKQAHIEAFIDLLLEADSQQKLSLLGAVPAVPTDVLYTNETMQSLYDAVRGALRVPDPFLFRRHKAKLSEEALLALDGNKKAFSERMKEVLKSA